MTVGSPGTLSQDAFLGGRLRLWQPVSGYRAGVDPVLLAAAVPARAGEHVLDLGCGAGAAMLCLAARVPGLVLAGVERQAEYAALARRNADDAAQEAEIAEACLTRLPPTLIARSFDHVIANPPYFRVAARAAAPDPGRAAARGEDTPLAAWVEIAARRLRPRGYLHLIQRAERLPELLSAAQARLGSLELLPLAAREGRAPDLVILRARKGGKAPFRLHAPLILHEGLVHLRDGESYRAWAQAVLRDAAPMPWPQGR